MQVLLFQISRELLFNVVKHAGTNRARVTLQQVDGNLVTEVIDQGRGFDPEQVREEQHEGFGRFSVRERLGFFGGTLQIDTAPGKGTRVVATVPIDESDAR